MGEDITLFVLGIFFTERLAFKVNHQINFNSQKTEKEEKTQIKQKAEKKEKKFQ